LGFAFQILGGIGIGGSHSRNRTHAANLKL